MPDKKKIGIITFHDTMNFGATIQCTALNLYLKKKGMEPFTINYLPQYIRAKKSPLRELYKMQKSSNKIKGILKGLCYLSTAPVLFQRRAKYRSFIRTNICLTKQYTTFDELKEHSPQADAFITGSDQVWNPNLTGGVFDPSFFLQFVETGKKIAYGISIGELKLENKKQELCDLTALISDISSREKNTAEKMGELIHRKVYTVADPTLLLEKDDYTPLERPHRSQKPYVLIYTVQNSPVVFEIAKKIAQKEKMEILDISPNLFFNLKGAKKDKALGPGEFLSVIKNAAYVVTNSFHGTALSVIYEKQFYSVPHSTRSDRVRSLLRQLGLLNRLAFDTDCLSDAPIDYQKVVERLRAIRRDSAMFLEAALGVKKVENMEASGRDKDNQTAISSLFVDQERYPLLTKQRTLCCGCGACRNICPESAITMENDEKGFPYPVISRDRCVRCLKCLKVCAFKQDLLLK